MIFRFHGFFLMLFCRRNYLEFSFSIGYDDWNKDFAVRLMVPFLLVSFGYEFQQAEILAMMQEDVENEDRKSTRLNSSHSGEARMPSSA